MVVEVGLEVGRRLGRGVDRTDVCVGEIVDKMIFQGHVSQTALDGKEGSCRLCILCVNPVYPIRNLWVPDIIIKDETTS